MNIRKKKLNKKFNISKLIPLMIVLVVTGVTIGFCAFQSSLIVTDISALVRVQEDMRVTGILASNSVGDAVANWEDYNVSSIKGGISLPNANSTVTYNVEFTNLGNIEAGISNISGLPNNLTYSISNYTVGDILCDDNNSSLCKLGSVSTLAITIGYAQNGYDSNTTTYAFNMNFTFYFLSAIARIGNTYYDTLDQAVSDVPTTGVQTEVILLKDTSEYITIDTGQNVLLNMQNRTLNCANTSSPVIEIGDGGTLTINNGTITSNASQGAINVNSGGTFYMSGGRIQAVYINGGSATISGNAYLSNTTSQRAAVQNQANSTLTITGGTIVASNHAAVNNSGTLRIGTQGGTVDSSSPLLQGGTYGVMSATDFSYYDGIIKGKNEVFDDESKITQKETGYGFLRGKERIGNSTYKTIYLEIIATVTFNPTDGAVDETSRTVKKGTAIGTLPTPIQAGYAFDGWFTAASGGTQINANTVINNDIEYFAHWTIETQVKYARIDSTEYSTLAAAWDDAMAANTTKTIVLLRDNALTSKLSVSSSKNVIVDLDGYTITTTEGTIFEVTNGGHFELRDSGSGGILNGGKVSNNKHVPVIVNKSGGNVTISSGTVTSNESQVIDNTGTMNITGGTISIGNVVNGIINNNSGGTLNISGGTIIASISGSKRQAVYNNGNLNISGTATLTSASTDRPTVQNLASRTVNITGGTIVSINQEAVGNAGTLVIGTKNGNIVTSTPILQGATYGVTNTSTFKFYDGILKGRSGAFSGVMTDKETNSTDVNGNETIGGQPYYTFYLN